MCGIFGFWLNRPLTDSDVARGQAMTAALAYRGPDGQGDWVDRDAGLYFGHRRLAILDLSDAGRQPMADGETVVTYNGEIYNFAELRQTLEAAGHRFTSSSDTEVLLAAWRHWGAACLDHFDGMFGFALYDGHRLHIATDPFGEKPVYVAQTSDGLYFASEPAPLIELLGLTFQPSDPEIGHFLALGYFPTPSTGYPGLEWLPAATLRTYETPASFREHRYWSLPPEGQKERFEATDLDALRDLLITLLARRMRADVPVGLFLSSGVDSALVAALVSREIGLPLTALTVSFPDGVDEAAGASAIAAHLGLPHTIVNSQQSEGDGDLPNALHDLFRVPNDNVSALSVEQMSHLARTQMTVALGGVGGDEAFYGYNKYAFVHHRRSAYRVPGSLIRLFAPLTGLHPKGRLLNRMLSGSDEERFVALKNSRLGDLQQEGLFRLPPLPGFGEDGAGMLQAIRSFDFRQTLPASYLASVDRGSMRASVEVRTPYLARELFEFCAQFSAQAMLGQGQKHALKAILRRYLPDALVDRPKRGFVFPLKRYFETAQPAPPKDPRLVALGRQVWEDLNQPGAEGLALRLLILDRFMQGQGAG